MDSCKRRGDSHKLRSEYLGIWMSPPEPSSPTIGGSCSQGIPTDDQQAPLVSLLHKHASSAMMTPIAPSSCALRACTPTNTRTYNQPRREAARHRQTTSEACRRSSRHDTQDRGPWVRLPRKLGRGWKHAAPSFLGGTARGKTWVNRNLRHGIQ